jgi:hypothetical protein
MPPDPERFSRYGGEPDFLVRSTHTQDVSFLVERSALTEASEVFRDMFHVCEPPEGGWEDVGDGQSGSTLEESRMDMDMPEPPDVLRMLFKLLHSPPAPLPSIKELTEKDKQYAQSKQYLDSVLQSPIPQTHAIPLPLLRPLYALADKYLLVPDLVHTLHSHLTAHTQAQPLEVYALATTLSLSEVAAYASSHLISPPLDTYAPSTLSILPSIESLHLLYLLHSHRIKEFHTILANEPIFPHGYGKCFSRGHTERAEEAWRRRKRVLLSMGRIEAGTDVSSEMREVLKSFEDCATCTKAGVAVVEMLEVRYCCSTWSRCCRLTVPFSINARRSLEPLRRSLCQTFHLINR